MQNITIQNETLPILGFGTWQIKGNDCVEAVADALALGYRHIDSAQGYENEAEVGQAIRDSGVPREDIFLTTKIQPHKHQRDQLLAAADESLAKLKMDSVDLLHLHWPNHDIPIAEPVGALRDLQQAGKVRHIGVSNFPPALFEEASKTATLFTNQVLYHPYVGQEQLLEQAAAMDYLITAYSPVARGKVNDDPVLKAIADAHGKTPAQVALRWLIQQPKVCVIPKAASPQHRRANMEIFDFELSDDEMAKVFALIAESRNG